MQVGLELVFSYSLLLSILQTATPIVEKLDPYNMFIQHRLFRESTRSVDGKIVKVDVRRWTRRVCKLKLLLGLIIPQS